MQLAQTMPVIVLMVRLLMDEKIDVNNATARSKSGKNNNSYVYGQNKLGINGNVNLPNELYDSLLLPFMSRHGGQVNHVR